MHTLNLGIVAHVDAGKTSLTERLLYDAGVVTELGSVDRGTTRTDSMDLERRRGITIRAAVVSFAVDDLTINLIDTPGHSEFISEVERALRVLDAAVLVVSAVEGVQAQTRLLFRTLANLRIPTVLFVNKIDRTGAADDGVLAAIARRLTPRAVPMTAVASIGTRAARVRPYAADDPDHLVRIAEVLADGDPAFLAEYLYGTAPLPAARIHRELMAQMRAARVHPVFFGSAITGAGVEELVHGIRTLLGTLERSREQRQRGVVFKIERADTGEKTVYVRMYAGALAVREPVTFYRRDPTGRVSEHHSKVTAVHVFENGRSVQASRVGAGTIAKVRGLAEARIGDQLGSPDGLASTAYFPPPTLESVVTPTDPADAVRLYDALRVLAEQDPLIDIRAGDGAHGVSVRLYGEVQQEVIQAQLAEDFGVDAVFEETRTIYVERPIGTGEALAEIDKHGHNDFAATVGLRVEPLPPGSGVRYRVAGPAKGTALRSFHAAIEETLYERLRHGLYGWEVVDCAVTLTRSGYVTGTVPRDFRGQTPVVAGLALERAGTRVCEPVNRVEVEAPADTISRVVARLTELGATFDDTAVRPDIGRLEAELPARRTHEFERGVPGLTRGEGIVLARFAGHRPVSGDPPRRRA